MEDFTPYPQYNPEDEYAPMDAQPAPETEASPASGDSPAATAPQEQEVIPTVPVQPVPQSPQEYRPPYQAAPVQPAQPVQPVQPVYGYQPPQNPQFPQYPQAPQNPPVQQMHQPVNGQPYPPYPPYPQNMHTAHQGYPQTPRVPQNAYPQNPYTQPQVYQAYPQQTPQMSQTPQKPPKTPTPTGTKVFIIVLIALLAAMVIGFIVYIANAAKNTKPESTNPFDNNGGFSFDNGDDNDGFWFEDSSAEAEEIEDEITLVADNGDTQKRDTDNEDSVGEPDENAKPLTLEELPKDKDDSKYTTTAAYEAVCDSVVTVECYLDEITNDDRDLASSGSGTIISADGYIITNAHVLDNSKEYLVQVILNNSDKYQAKIVGYDTWTDLAVLKIDAKDLKPVTFGDSKLINVGDDVIAIGSPGGEKFQNSLTRGIVSAVDRELSINRTVRYIQSDAAISPGNSGGPLCNIYGQVIGITTAKTIATNYENMSFSIPSETVKEIVDDLMRYGYVKDRTRIGFMGSEISEQDAYYYGYPQGVQIGEIDESGSLANSKLKEGDIITELDGVEITSFQDIYDVLADHKPGDKISVTAVRYK